MYYIANNFILLVPLLGAVLFLAAIHSYMQVNALFGFVFCSVMLNVMLGVMAVRSKLKAICEAFKESGKIVHTDIWLNGRVSVGVVRQEEL